MNKRLLKKFNLGLVAKTLFFFILTICFYYFFFLKPAIDRPSKVLEIEKALVINKLHLVQNRSAFLSFKRLDPTSPKLVLQKERIFGTLIKSKEEGLAEIKSTRIPEVSGINVNEIDTLLEQTQQVYVTQEGIIRELENLNGVLQNIFLYVAREDLGLDVNKDQEVLIERSQKTIEGLNNISNKLQKDFVDNQKTLEVVKQLEATIQMVEEFRKNLINKNFDGAVSARKLIREEFLKLRDVALESEVAIITSKDSIALITKQTNLIHKYNFWLDRLRSLAKRD